MKKVIPISTGLLIFVIFFAGDVCHGAGWDTGLKVGFDSNVNRAVKNEKSDSYLSGYLSFNREATGESRTDWFFNATLEGTGYNRYSDLSYGSISVSPGLLYVPHKVVSITVSPFFEAKAVKDPDQSALTMGGKVMFREMLLPDVYLGQYYIFRASSANENTYSFTENGLGIFAGARLSERVTGEVGYEYTYGDSFMADDSASSGQKGKRKGRNPTFSKTFQESMVRESVDRNAIGANLNVEWGGHVSTVVGYVYTSMRGDSGTAKSHTGYFGINYRF